MESQLCNDPPAPSSMIIPLPPPSVSSLLELRITYKCLGCYEEFQNLTKFTNHVEEKHRTTINEQESKDTRKQNITEWQDRHDINDKSLQTTTISSTEVKKSRQRVPRNVKARTCYICKAVLPSLSECFQHYRQVHNKAVFECSEEKDDYDGQLNKRGSCPYCKKQFKHIDVNVHIMLTHVWPVSWKKDCQCDICGKTFRYTNNLNAHIQTVHTKTMPRRSYKHRQLMQDDLICDICGFITKEKRRLNAHRMAVHQGVLMYKCDHCSYETWERTSMRNHVYRHSSVKKFLCQICQKYQCIRKRQLKLHMEKKHGVQLADYQSIVAGKYDRDGVAQCSDSESSSKICYNNVNMVNEPGVDDTHCSQTTSLAVTSKGNANISLKHLSGVAQISRTKRAVKGSSQSKFWELRIVDASCSQNKTIDAFSSQTPRLAPKDTLIISSLPSQTLSSSSKIKLATSTDEFIIDLIGNQNKCDKSVHADNEHESMGDTSNHLIDAPGLYALNILRSGGDEDTNSHDDMLAANSVTTSISNDPVVDKKQTESTDDPQMSNFQRVETIILPGSEGFKQNYCV